MIGRLLVWIAIELLVAWAAYSVAARLGFGPPISLLVLYALFRTLEYYALKYYRTLVEDPVIPDKTVRLVISLLLTLARVAGWGMLIVFAVKAGIGITLSLVVVAFVLSLAFQSVYEYTIKPLRAVGFLITLAAVPLTVFLIFLRVLGQ